MPPATLAAWSITCAQASHLWRPAFVVLAPWAPLRRQLSVGPEAVVSILTGSALMGLAPDPADTELLIGFNVTLTFFVGCITLVMGIMRLGFVECILSRATNRGFILGVAAVIIIEQLPKFFGLNDHVFEHTETPILKLVGVLENLGDTKWQCAVMGIVGLAFLLTTGELKKKYNQYAWVRLFPTIMTLLITTLLINFAMQLPIPSLGDTNLEGGFAKPRAPKVRPCFSLGCRCSRAPLSIVDRRAEAFLHQWDATRIQFDSDATATLALSSVVITLVGFIESFIATKVYANKHGYFVSANRELVALGTANVVAGFFGSYSAFGSMPRTAVRYRQDPRDG